MAFFARKKPPAPVPDTRNLAGGEAFTMSPRLAFASALGTALLADTYYKSAGTQVAHIATLARELDDPRFAAKAAIFTRHQNGLRSVSHLVAGELSRRPDVKGAPWLRRFFSRVVVRPDDVTEILAYLKANGQPELRKLSNAMKRGLGDALVRFDAYQLAKYRQTRKEVSLVDAVNLLHPKATEALTALMTGTLAPADTWETRVSAAGQVAAAQGLNEEAKAQAKGEAYAELLATRKMGYLAILRNLRNIAEQAPTSVPLALTFLTDPVQVRKSKVLPFQFLTALEALAGSRADSNAVKRALDQAMDLSLAHVPVFEGPTLIAVDGSGSMRPGYGSQTPRRHPLRLAALMAAVLYKSQQDCDVIGFADRAQVIRGLHPRDSLATLAGQIESKAPQGGTDFNSVFRAATRAYDRIIILSDMQAWVGRHTPVATFRAYRKAHRCDPRIYSFDLTGHGTLQFPESRVYALAGFSDAVLAVMQRLERDPQALVHEIEQVVL